MSRDESQLGFGWEAETLLSRRDWVSACEFSQWGEAEVLKEVCKRASSRAHSIVLLDLDSTLYEVTPRSGRILKEWAKSSDSLEFSVERNAVCGMSSDQVGYSIKDSFQNLGLNDGSDRVKRALDSARKFWFSRFFTNEYLKWDHAYPGAAKFAHSLYEAGAYLIYLTGRDEPGMGEGTRANLIRDGFPWGLPRIRLMMKPSFHEDDLGYKKRVTSSLSLEGHVMASFENEPPNVVALSDQFPEAMHIFVDTVCGATPAPVRNGFYKIRGFTSVFEAGLT